MTYCWKCFCGRTLEREVRPSDDTDPPACSCGNYMIRDYRAESIGVDLSWLRKR